MYNNLVFENKFSRTFSTPIKSHIRLQSYIIYQTVVNRAIMTDPQKATQYKTLGNQAFKNKDYQAAIEHFTKAIQCNPSDHTFFSNRSNSYINVGQYDKALEDAESCIKVNPKWARGYQRKGTALFYLDKIQDAINVYQEGLKIDPQNVALKDDLKAAQDKINGTGFSGGFGGGFPGVFPGGGGGMNQAYLQSMMKLISNPETKDLISDPSFMQKMQACMQNPALLQTYMQQDPRVAKAFQVLSKDIPQNFNMDDLMGGKGQEKQSHQPKNQHASPQKPAPKKEQKMDIEDPAQQAKTKGNAQFKKKNFQGALGHYEDAISQNPNEPLYYNNKAACYIELGDYENAMNEVTKAEKLFDDGVVKDYSKKGKVYARKASILLKQEKYDEAINWYEKSLVEDHNQKVKEELARVRKHKKEMESKAYINPELAQQSCTKGNALFKDGKFPQALREYDQAIKRNPEVPKYYSNLGTVYIKLMEFARARDQFDLAIAKDPTFIKAYPKKADAHYALKEYHKALETYEAGLKRDPQNQLCKQGIQKTQQAIYMSNSQEDQEARAKRALSDPEIQSILQTPEVRNALAEMERDPKSIQKILQNKDLAAKIQKLIEAGILKVG